MKLSVFGSTGRTGRQVLTQALARGHEVTAFTRRPAELAGVRGLRAVVSGDGRDPVAVKQAVTDQDAVIVIVAAAGRKDPHVAAGVTATVMAAMADTGVRRLVTVSAYGLVARRPWPASSLVRVLLATAFADQLAADQTVAESSLDWTVLRATMLSDGKDRGGVRLDPGLFHRGPYRITRTALATAILDVTENPTLTRQTLTPLTAGVGASAPPALPDPAVPELGSQHCHPVRAPAVLESAGHITDQWQDPLRCRDAPEQDLAAPLIKRSRQKGMDTAGYIRIQQQARSMSGLGGVRAAHPGGGRVRRVG